MTLSDWTPHDWIALAAVAASTATAVLTVFYSQRREVRQQNRDDQLRREQQAREDSLREIERFHVPQIEFEVDCYFHGPQQESYIVEVLLTVRNKGRVKQEFDVKLRIRGIQRDQPLNYWKGREPRLDFPIKLVDNVSILPEGVAQFFAEPGETNTFTYVTRIPVTISYVLAYATFSYDAETSHDAERVFAVRPQGQRVE